MQIPKKYYLWLGVGLLLLIIFEFLKKEEIDWRPTFSCFDNIPYGCEVNYRLAAEGNWKGKIQRSNKTFYEHYSQDSSKATFIYIAEKVIFDNQSFNALLKHIENGNTVFISSDNGLDQLWSNFNIAVNLQRIKGDSIVMNINKDVAFSYKTTNNKKLQHFPYFTWHDSIKNVSILGMQNKLTNFINIKHGKGNLLFHLNPYAFTNLNLAKQASYNYVNAVFSYLPNQQIIWDDFMNYGHRQSASEMRVVLSSVPMRIAYYLMCILLILYLGLAWRRKQKMIPVIVPLKNNSIEFIDTLTNLYLSNKNNAIIANYLVKNFRLKMNRKYFIHWNKPTNVITQQLVNYCGKSEEQVKKLLTKLDISEKKKTVSQSELIELNKNIEEFVTTKTDRLN